ncbi:hypothetical protein [Saccharothrix coeruleofusca]|uniref:hypothetical protein n=1 Tax=Saccharothrix coeruleofusca TaxID=33919 RepID=UPI00167167E5|nr:hypothetical protein [Saccharothrix coeruleofusca]
MPEPNRLLRAVREATASRQVAGAHMSRRELADAAVAWLHETTGRTAALDAHYIAKLERGVVRRPSQHYRAALRAVLGVAADVDLGFSAHRPPALVATPPVGAVATPNTVEELLMSAAEESSGFLAWAETTNVGELTVDQMHAEVRRIAHSYLKAPTLPLFARTKALRDRAFTLLAGHQDPRRTRELYAAAGWSLTVLSWISVDLGRPDAAEDHARAAWMCAERADHNALRAWVRATQHTAAFWQADYTAAAQYAADGLSYGGTGTARLFLSSALAVDLAHAGQVEAAERALLRAQHVAETAAPAEDELAGPLTCSTDRAGSLWSDAELALGRADAALSFADRAVAAFEATAEQRRNRGSERMARLQQVKAHLALGDLRSAEDALRPVLDTPAAQRVRPLVHRVTEVGVLAAQAGGTGGAAARRIRGAVADFRGNTVATRELGP